MEQLTADSWEGEPLPGWQEGAPSGERRSPARRTSGEGWLAAGDAGRSGTEGMASASSPTGWALLVRAAGLVCAVPLPHVGETMPPLPVEPVAGAPSFVRGVSVIRGEPVPVVDLGCLVSGHAAEVSRFVTVQAGERRVALAVEGVVGLHHLQRSQLGETPRLLGAASADVVEAIGTLDAQLLFVLRSARILPDEVWRMLAAEPAEAR